MVAYNTGQEPVARCLVLLGRNSLVHVLGTASLGTLVVGHTDYVLGPPNTLVVNSPSFSSLLVSVSRAEEELEAVLSAEMVQG